MFFILLPALIPYIKNQKVRLNRQRLQQLDIQFKDAVLAISAGLSTGYAMENAVREALREIETMHGIQSCIYKELQYMLRQLELNIPVEEVFHQLAERAGLADIETFSEVFSIAKRTGGDMVKIMKSTAGNISEKMEVKRETQLLMSAKKFEQSIMMVVPVFIILYINLTSPGFLDPLYGTLPGVSVMTICLLLYLAAYVLADWITRIEV